MNTNYSKISANVDLVKEKLLSAAEKVSAIDIPADIPHGDMPGDKIEIGESHVSKAKTIFPKLIEELKKTIDNNEYGRAVIAVCGGSGVGKSEIASCLSYLLEQAGIGSYTMSGDNYPHRIPMYNDAERLHVYRESGIRAMVDAGVMSAENMAVLKKWQEAEDDANKAHEETDTWFRAYREGGEKGLNNYLGTPNETDFDEVDQIMKAFKDGADKLWLKRMGRDEASLWYDEVDMSEKQVLIVEWTHGNSDYMSQVDIPVLLNSTPQETLEHRRSRNRDGKLDSPFTMMVLELEQNKLVDQAHKAKIIITKAGELIDYSEFKKLMGI
ncbi:adenylylsulfate kinase [Butyrivibrio sp. YAB3001]|uniref:adenylylsulfate kinase n=1 Tax=Butyrivibrio sp. YAB3001 TaxID=1520812 RepID=UPI0008F63E18|nr:adenylylsulfate kinase [Butyrivibrio sp. YAB3001]SFB88146.1 alpha-galactosidase [Butyrivibrio sp. YAB3001]